MTNKFDYANIEEEMERIDNIEDIKKILLKLLDKMMSMPQTFQDIDDYINPRW